MKLGAFANPERIIELRSKGKTFREIGKIEGISHQRAQQVYKKFINGESRNSGGQGVGHSRYDFMESKLTKKTSRTVNKIGVSYRFSQDTYQKLKDKAKELDYTDTTLLELLIQFVSTCDTAKITRIVLESRISVLKEQLKQLDNKELEINTD